MLGMSLKEQGYTTGLWRRQMETKTLNEVRIPGFELLVKNPGPADALWFIRSYSHGSGNYTENRKKWPETNFDAVVEGIMEKRKKTPD